MLAGLTGRGDVMVGRGSVMESTEDLLVLDSIRITIDYSFTRHKSGFPLTSTVQGTESLRHTDLPAHTVPNP